MTYEVRVATEADRKWVVNVAAPASFMNEVKRPELNNKQQLHLIANKIIVDGTGLICYDEEQPVGVLAGVQTPHFLNPEHSLMFSVFWYVKPEYRKTRVPALLLKRYKELCLSRGNEGLLVVPPEVGLKDSSLEKLGWKLSEKQYSVRI